LAATSIGPRQHYCRRPVQYGLGSPSSIVGICLQQTSLKKALQLYTMAVNILEKRTPATATKSTVCVSCQQHGSHLLHFCREGTTLPPVAICYARDRQELRHRYLQ
jgi:hypothetical protein